MFNPRSDSGYRQPLAGIQQKTLTFGDKTLMVEFKLAKGSLLPTHAHSYEQTGYLISGQLRLRIGGEEEFEARAGDAWCIPANGEHGVRVIEEAVTVEVFSPVREDYWPREPLTPRSADIRHPSAKAQVARSAYSPLNWGLRFSRNAVSPS